MRRERLDALESLRERMLDHDGTDAVVLAEVERRIHDVRRQIEDEAYTFDRHSSSASCRWDTPSSPS